MLNTLILHNIYTYTHSIQIYNKKCKTRKVDVLVTGLLNKLFLRWSVGQLDKSPKYLLIIILFL